MSVVGRILTLRTMTRRAAVTQPVLLPAVLPEPATVAAALVRKVHPARRLPPRDASGSVVGVVEVAVTTTSDQRERFRSLAVALHRRWFLERPSPITAAPPPAISAAS